MSSKKSVLANVFGSKKEFCEILELCSTLGVNELLIGEVNVVFGQKPKGTALEYTTTDSARASTVIDIRKRKDLTEEELNLLQVEDPLQYEAYILDRVHDKEAYDIKDQE